MAQEIQTATPQTSTEENVYSVVYYVLLGGMIVSSIMFAIGIVRALEHPTFFPLTPEWVKEHYNVAVVIHGLRVLDPTALMMVACVLLILTPVSRVLVSIYAFLVDRDFKFVAVTTIVFLIMVATVIAGLLGLK
jgi:uncharacterized membrane protein